METDSHHKVAGADVRLLVIGDHASAYIPERLGGLGLSETDRARHIAVDIGTEDLLRGVCARLGCPGVLAGVSRLVIDANREPDHAGLIPTESDGTAIAANADLGAQELAWRRKLYEGYHGAVARALSAADAESGAPAMLVSLHSFTPKPLTGERRGVDVGMLAKRDEDGGDWARAERFLEALPDRFVTGMNQPYSAYDLAYTVNRHATGQRPQLAVEVRQDHLGSDAGIAAFVGYVSDAIRPLIP